MKRHLAMLRKRDGVLLVLVVCLLILLPFWWPAARDLRELAQRVARVQADLAWMMEHASQVAPQKVAGESLMVLLNRQLQEQGLVGHVQEDGPDKVRLTLDRAPFPQLAKGLEMLSQQGIYVNTSTLEGLESPGMVRVQLVLSR